MPVKLPDKATWRKWRTEQHPDRPVAPEAAYDIDTVGYYLIGRLCDQCREREGVHQRGRVLLCPTCEGRRTRRDR